MGDEIIWRRLGFGLEIVEVVKGLCGICDVHGTIFLVGSDAVQECYDALVVWIHETDEEKDRRRNSLVDLFLCLPRSTRIEPR